MNKAKKATLTIIVLLFIIRADAQSGINYALTPPQLGILINPGLLNESDKFSIQFKFRGDSSRYRMNVNYFIDEDDEFGNNEIELAEVNNNYQLYRIWYDDNQSIDFRFGMEKRIYTDFCHVQYWAGTDLILGYYQSNKYYYHYQEDKTSGWFMPSAVKKLYDTPKGSRKSDYLKAGINIFQCFSFTWLKKIVVDVRTSMDITGNLKLNDRIVSDNDRVLINANNWFVDFRLSLVEIALNYEF